VTGSRAGWISLAWVDISVRLVLSVRSALSVRRVQSALTALTVLLALAGVAAPAHANDFPDEPPEFRHGFAFFGILDYPPDFQHFEYVNPDAPVGGELVIPIVGTFNSFTPWTQKGINPAGAGFVGIWNFLYDRLLEPSDDEPTAQYARLAESIAAADDYSWFKVRIDPRARWHDGVPVTATDLLFTHNYVLKHASAPIRNGLAHFGKAEQTGDGEVTFYITDPAFRNPSAGLTVGHLPILPAHYWEREGNDVTKTTTTPPLGSGPYRIAEVDPGRRIVYERVDDYWGLEVPSMRGRHNYQRIIFEYFRDNTVAREAAKKGIVSFRSEGVAKDWMTSYENFPPLDDGVFVKELTPHKRITAMRSAIMLNTRRPYLADRRVRRALTYAYDFEWINRVLNFGFYNRVQSFFDNSALAATGIPEGLERELLLEFADQLPPEIFTEPFTLPKSSGRGLNRDNMLRAQQLFAEAGWNVVDGKLVNSDGKQFRFEMLTRNASEERGALPFVAALKRLGIMATVRTADAAQYRNRVRNFEFDGAIDDFWATPTLGTYIKSFFHSTSANMPFTENFPGISHPAVDAFIERALSTHDRAELYAAAHALDRTMLHQYYLIPTQVDPGGRWTYWDRFSRPETSAKLNYHSFPDTWWVDPVKNARVENYLTKQVSDGGDDEG